MRLAWLQLTDFRSYPDLRFDPDDGINLLIGPNGSGKTAVLEAVAYLGYLRSFRGVPDEALVSLDADTAVLRGEVDAAGGTHIIGVSLPRAGRRAVEVDGKRPRRNRELRRFLRAVTFLPDDLNIVKTGSAIRRNLLDDIAGDLHPTALADQSEYEKAVRQRNALLKQDFRPSEPELTTWDEQVALTGARVHIRRMEVIDLLAPLLTGIYRDLSGSDENLAWSYESKWASGVARDEQSLSAGLVDALLESRAVDLARRSTTRGPHRDDPALRIGNRDGRVHASQGEQRSIVLALRLATFDLLRDTFSEAPIMLLDDVFSELDVARSKALLERLPGAQVLITAARREDVPVGGRMWDVSMEEGQSRVTAN